MTFLETPFLFSPTSRPQLWLFQQALNSVIEAREGTSQVAKEELKRLLREEESPNLMTLTSILKTVELTIDFKPTISANQD